MRHSLRFHYEQIEIKNQKYLPLSNASIIAATHPNSFLDAIFCAAYCKRKLYFLARGDVFKNPIANLILRRLNLIPIYRASEGIKNLNKNESTFEQCHSILEKGGAILIFVEGISLVDKKVRPLKKGLSRIAFGTEERNKFQLEVNIVSLGVNYQKIKDYHNKVWLNYGKAKNLKSLHSKYFENKNLAYQQLNKDLFKDLNDLSLISNHEDILDVVLEFFPSSDFNNIQNISKKIDELNTNQRLKMNLIIQEAKKLKKAAKVKRVVLKKSATKTNKLAIRLMYYIAFVYCFIPLKTSQFICDRYVKLDEFYDSFRIVLNTLFTLFWAVFTTMFFVQKFGFLCILIPFLIYQFGSINHMYFRLKNYAQLNRQAEIKNKLNSIKKELLDILNIEESYVTS